MISGEYELVTVLIIEGSIARYLNEKKYDVKKCNVSAQKPTGWQRLPLE